MKPEKEIMAQLIKIILDTACPLRILLFGSAARDEMTEESDIDILLVVPEGTNKIQISRAVYPKLISLGDWR